MSSEQTLILKLEGLQCPLPLLRTKQAMYQLSSGDTLCVFTTDPSSKHDFQQFAKLNGHTLIAVQERDGIYQYTIKKTET